MIYVGDAKCGCPLYDMQPGIAKVHNNKCKERPRERPKGRRKGGEK